LLKQYYAFYKNNIPATGNNYNCTKVHIYKNNIAAIKSNQEERYPLEPGCYNKCKGFVEQIFSMIHGKLNIPNQYFPKDYWLMKCLFCMLKL
jgi:hypothetical protein